MGLTRGPDGDLDVLSQGGEKVHEAFHRKGAGAVAHQSRYVGLFDPREIREIRGQTELTLILTTF
jgi:hypothetical protein